MSLNTPTASQRHLGPAGDTSTPCKTLTNSYPFPSFAMFSSKSSPRESISEAPPSKILSSPMPDYFAVYIVRFTVGLKDPDIPGPRFHHTIWVETDPKDKDGVKFHVIGDITSKGGMTYKSEECHDPMAELECHNKELLGYTAAEGFRDDWDRILSGLPTPPKQKEFNVKTLKTELVKCWDPITFYAPGEERHVPWKCTEWTNDYAIPALHEAGLVIQFENGEGDNDGQ